jgi:peptidoglycan-N-acetylglucosamine deacetylase
MCFHFSIDVDWIPGSDQGLRALFDFCDKKRLAPTLFIAGRFAQEYPELIREAAARNHELGTHGWEHGLEEEDFTNASYDQQKLWIDKSTSAIERITGERPTIFRAPNLWISETTFHVLENSGYHLDSSVPVGRMDLGIGMVRHTRYLCAPRNPYYPSVENLAKPGYSHLLEVPPSAFFIPVNMSALRTLGLASVKWAIRRIQKRTPVLVFYSHPAEFVEFHQMTLPPGEPARYTQGLGPHNFAILEELVAYIQGMGYESMPFSVHYRHKGE